MPGQSGYWKCPVCGYWAFDGEYCHDCGWRPKRCSAMSELLVRIVSVKCQECGGEPQDPTEGMDPSDLAPLRLSPRFVARIAIEKVCDYCGGRVLIATEPVQQEAGE